MIRSVAILLTGFAIFLLTGIYTDNGWVRLGVATAFTGLLELCDSWKITGYVATLFTGVMIFYITGDYTDNGWVRLGVATAFVGLFKLYFYWKRKRAGKSPTKSSSRRFPMIGYTATLFTGVMIFHITVYHTDNGWVRLGVAAAFVGLCELGLYYWNRRETNAF